MSNVLPFSAAPTNRVRLILAAPPGCSIKPMRIDAMVERSARPGVDRVADCLLALEAACYAEPCILPVRNLSRQGRVAVVLPGYDRLLTPDDARSVAAALRADNAFSGAWTTALSLDRAADDAERRDGAGGPLNPKSAYPKTPRGGGRTLIALILLACAVAGLIALNG